jgi:hypothetical protein
MPAHVDAIVILNGPGNRFDTALNLARARLRVRRCFPGSIYVVTAPLPAYEWPYAVINEWAATVKAVLLQRSC